MLGFIASIFLRVLIGRPHVAQSILAGLVFAASLLVLSIAVGVRVPFSWRAVGIGVAGGAGLLLIPLLTHVYHNEVWHVGSGYLLWAAGASIVATCEELFLRGALFGTLQVWHGDVFAVCTSAVLFALLHLPLYGWHSVLLDAGVGVFLGVLRLTSGSTLSPVIAHILADLGGWWLR